MKKIFYCLFTMPLLLFSSCVGEVDDLFPESASHRMMTALANYEKVLVGAPNGWLADYYPEQNYAVGGYAMYFKFHENGKADISCEIKTKVDAGVVATSQFDLIPEQGPVLAFMTYNPVLHYFTEPKSSSLYGDPTNDVNGFMGDHEFVVISATSDVVELVGKKNKNRLTLRNNKDNVDPKAYYASLPAIEEIHSGFPIMSLNINGETLGDCATVDRTLSTNIKDAAGANRKIAYTYTPDGIRFAYPYEFNGVEVQNFTLDEATGKYTCTDPGVNANLQSYLPDNYQLVYEEFLGTWKFSYFNTYTATTRTERTVTIRPKKKNASLWMGSREMWSFTDMNGNPLDATLNFNPIEGSISLLVQNIGWGIYSDKEQNPRLSAWNGAAGSVNYTLTYGMNGAWNKDADGQRVLTFETNKLWVGQEFSGFILYLFDRSTPEVRSEFSSNAGGSRFKNPVLTKISDEY